MPCVESWDAGFYMTNLHFEKKGICVQCQGWCWNNVRVKEFDLTELFSLSDGELYAGVYVDFMGTDSAIFRTLGTKTAMRTDQYNSRWLNGNCTI